MKIIINCLVSSVLTLTFLVLSCSQDPDEVFSAEETDLSNDESTEESSTEELDDLASLVLAMQESASGGRIKTDQDSRVSCAGTTVVFSEVAIDKSSGTATINFGTNGCTDARGNLRKGTVVVRWEGGKWFKVGSSHTIELHEYSVNGILIAGSRTLTCTSVLGTLESFSISWHVTANHSITWTDGSTAIRSVHKMKQWDHSSTEDVLWISKSDDSEFVAQGTNRYNNTYTVSITSPVKYSIACARSNEVFLPVQGIKVMTQTDKHRTFSVDFGDGSCDNNFTVTIDGRSRTLTAQKASGI